MHCCQTNGTFVHIFSGAEHFQIGILVFGNQITETVLRTGHAIFLSKRIIREKFITEVTVTQDLRFVVLVRFLVGILDQEAITVDA